jgi:hypothetical protein
MTQHTQVWPLAVEVKTYYLLDCIDLYMFTVSLMAQMMYIEATTAMEAMRMNRNVLYAT